MSNYALGDGETTRLTRRGDSFDIGEYLPPQEKDVIVRVLENPSKLAELLNLDEKQAENIRSIIVGAGTGGIHKLLSKHLGHEVSAMLGGFIAGYVARKVLGNK